MLPAKKIRMMKIDIDGPEAGILPSLVTHAGVIDSIIIEITWSRFRAFGASLDVSTTALQDLFSTYLVFLVYEKEFPKYPADVLATLVERRDVLAFPLCYQVSRDQIRQVMDMNMKSTKNLFFIKPEILEKLSSSQYRRTIGSD
jgi:hypothetical protein